MRISTIFCMLLIGYNYSCIKSNRFQNFQCTTILIDTIRDNSISFIIKNNKAAATDNFLTTNNYKNYNLMYRGFGIIYNNKYIPLNSSSSINRIKYSELGYHYFYSVDPAIKRIINDKEIVNISIVYRPEKIRDSLSFNRNDIKIPIDEAKIIFQQKEYTIEDMIPYLDQRK